jgi:radical SAM superfamily enzyme YgiQ (UPF0313 family)
MWKKNVNIVLVGLEPPGSENLAIRVLAKEACQAGFEARVSPIRSLENSSDAIQVALKLNPGVIGFSLQDSVSAIRTLPLALLARKKGFKGVIVCGGPFATLQTDWVLSRAPGVDAVIRHAGERPLVDLLCALRAGEDPSDVPGMVTRDGPNKKAAPELAQPSAWRPLRGPRPEIMGVPTAEILSSIGCKERCDYCTHAAVSSIAVREYREAGVSKEALQESGLGRTVQRPMDDLVGEISELYHEHGVRYFQFVDENPIPAIEADALGRITRMKEMFAKRKVEKIAFSMLLRGAELTTPVIDALADLGMVRTLIGIESGTLTGLESLGRTGSVEKGKNALERLGEHKVVSMFNSLMIHPSSTLESIRAEIEFLGTVGHALFETVEAAPFTGTALNARMKRQNRLQGGVLLPVFTSEDKALERFRMLRNRLRVQALGAYTPAFRAHDLLLSAAVLRRVGGQPAALRIESRTRELVLRINKSRLDALRSLIDAAEENFYASDIIRRYEIVFGDYVKQLMELSDELVAMAGPGARLSRHCRNFAATAALVFALSGTQGCGLTDASEPESGQAGDTDTDADTDTDSDSDTDSDTDTDSDSDSDAGDGECSESETDEDMDELTGLIQQNCVTDGEDEQAEVHIALDENGGVETIEITTSQEEPPAENPDWVEEIVECFNELLKDEVFPCLAGEDLDIWLRDWGTPV